MTAGSRLAPPRPLSRRSSPSSLPSRQRGLRPRGWGRCGRGPQRPLPRVPRSGEQGPAATQILLYEMPVGQETGGDRRALPVARAPAVGGRVAQQWGGCRAFRPSARFAGSSPRPVVRRPCRGFGHQRRGFRHHCWARHKLCLKVVPALDTFKSRGTSDLHSNRNGCME